MADFDTLRLGVYDNVHGEFGIYSEGLMPNGQTRQNQVFWVEARGNLNQYSPLERDIMAREMVRRWNQHKDVERLVKAAKAALYICPQGQPEYVMLEDALEPWLEEDKARIRAKAEQVRKERGYGK